MDIIWKPVVGYENRYEISSLGEVYPKKRPGVKHRILLSEHLDGNKHNNQVSNLEWCTNLENMRHSVRIGIRDYSKIAKARWKHSQ